MAQDTLDLEEVLNNWSKIWIFGYGSILWKPGFRYNSRRIGHVHGFNRRFWQGNTTHRGTPESPGRVATLVPSADRSDKAWGVAFEVKGAKRIRKALEHLGIRECSLGGYIATIVSFCSDLCSSSSCSSSICDMCSASEPCSACSMCSKSSVPVLVFCATPDNDLYLGPASTNDLASQIVACRGNAGHNVEYVLRLAEYVREYIPQDKDRHLFELETVIRNKLREKNMCPEALITSNRPGHENLRKDGKPADITVSVRH